MRTGERAKVLKLERPTKEERERWVGEEGLVMRRLNVAWSPEHGELWEVRFDSGEVIVFSASELAVVRGGRAEPLEMEELAESWGKAPRTSSLPFRRFGAGLGGATAVLALLVLALAGALLLWAGASEGNVWLAVAGAGCILAGIVAAMVTIT